MIRGGDPFEHEFRMSADAVGNALAPVGPTRVAFQSQGVGTGMEWLRPDFGTLKAPVHGGSVLEVHLVAVE